ncbi:ABC transporter substrate-binding protein, partial [bacterium]|nr:ABC transporter substrate-binding protein [bacterium]
MRIQKIIPLILLFCSIHLSALTILAPKAPPSIPLLKVAESDKEVKIVFYTDLLSQVIPKIVQNKDVLFIMPTNVAAKLKNRGKNLKLIGVLSDGLLSIVSSEKGVTKVGHLSGQKVMIGAPGSSPDIIARHFFKTHNASPTILYRSTPEIAKLFIAGRIKNAVLPEPYASFVLAKTKNSVRVAELKGNPQVALIGSEATLKKHNKEIESLVQSYKNAVLWVNKHPHNAALLGKKKMNLKMSIPVIESAIPRMNLVFR